MTDKNDKTENLPEDLVKHLRLADQAQPLITSRVDRELRELASTQFAGRRPVWRQRPAWAAVAATVLITIFVVQLRDPAIVEETSLYADVDNSGRIDIADVLAAARNNSQASNRQAELDAFAMRIVSLSPAEDSS